jgi:hypothetical protein
MASLPDLSFRRAIVRDHSDRDGFFLLRSAHNDGFSDLANPTDACNIQH